MKPNRSLLALLAALALGPGLLAAAPASALPAGPVVQGAAASELSAFERTIDAGAEWVIEKLDYVLFAPLYTHTSAEGDEVEVPLVLAWLLIGAIFFTLRMGFINLRAFKHAIQVTRGKFDNPDDPGEVSHFQALASALSATVGLGNIAGVAIAISVGGPGAIFWMIIVGILGMSSKFAECTLGQMYREVRPDGRVMGGAMFYLQKGLAELPLGFIGKPLGKILAIMFAIFCIGGSLGGGNTFQVNQAMNALSAATEGSIPVEEYSWVYGLVMAVLVGIVIIGGIKRIAATAEKIVPFMCGLYILSALAVLAINAGEIPAAFGEIFSQAFNADAAFGGFIGVLVTGVRRAAFSNEAGIGSAAIAHSAARTEYPVREGIVALLEPFIDTVVVCTMTGLVIVITGAYENPDYQGYIEANEGAALTAKTFGAALGDWFPYVLSVAVFLFAYSTIISWSYYGERCWAYLFGDRTSLIYRIIAVSFVFLGSQIQATNVLNFGDMMIFSMAFPNVFGVLLLSGKVRQHLDSYWGKLKRGELKTYK